jgi:hypothetical protein
MKEKGKYCFMDKERVCSDSCPAMVDGECSVLRLVKALNKIVGQEPPLPSEIFGNQYSPPEVV